MYGIRKRSRRELGLFAAVVQGGAPRHRPQWLVFRPPLLPKARVRTDRRRWPAWPVAVIGRL